MFSESSLPWYLMFYLRIYDRTSGNLHYEEGPLPVGTQQGYRVGQHANTGRVVTVYEYSIH